MCLLKIYFNLHQNVNSQTPFCSIIENKKQVTKSYSFPIKNSYHIIHESVINKKLL